MAPIRRRTLPAARSPSARGPGTIPFEEGRGVRWAICLKSDLGAPGATPIGTCSLLDWEDEPVSKAELGYSLEPERWGRGYATEAIREIERFGFAVMGLDRIEALVWDRNERSIQVLERLGYRRVELRRESHRDGSGLLRDEWLYVLDRPAG